MDGTCLNTVLVQRLEKVLRDGVQTPKSFLTVIPQIDGINPDSTSIFLKPIEYPIPESQNLVAFHYINVTESDSRKVGAKQNCGGRFYYLSFIVKVKLSTPSPKSKNRSLPRYVEIPMEREIPNPEL